MNKRKYKRLIAAKPLNWTAFDALLYETAIKAYNQSRRDKK